MDRPGFGLAAKFSIYSVAYHMVSDCFKFLRIYRKEQVFLRLVTWAWLAGVYGYDDGIYIAYLGGITDRGLFGTVVAGAFAVDGLTIY